MKWPRWRPTCRPTPRPGRAWSFPPAPRGKSVANVYRDMIEGRIRNDDARPLLAGIKCDCRQPAPQLDSIAKIVERLHREVRYTGVEFGAARLIPEYPVRDAAAPLRRLQGQVDPAGGGAARLRHRRLRGAAVRGRRPGRGRGSAGPRHVQPRHRLRARRVGAARICGSTPPPNTRASACCPRRTPTAWHWSSATARATSPARRRCARPTIARSRPASSSSPNTDRRASSKPPRPTAPSKANTAPGTPARTPSRASMTSSPTRAIPIAPRNWCSYEHTESDDFSKPYSMSIEMKDAPVGFTDLETAAVGINVANITARLPDYFDERAGRQTAKTRARRPHRRRGVRALRHRVAIPHPAAAGISAARRCRLTMC